MRKLVITWCLSIGICHLSIAQKATSFTPYEQEITGFKPTIKMVPIPAGKFKLGSPQNEPGRSDDEGPQKEVSIDAFWMGAYEITFDQYDMYANRMKDTMPLPDGMTRPSPPYIDLTLGMGKSGGYPANSMSQYGALMFCKWLYQKTGVFYRLPTEAEWEYACRAGSTTAFYFGSDSTLLDNYAYYNNNSGSAYQKVGQLKPNDWGLYDMLGNVAEWTLDQYDPKAYAHLAKSNPHQKPTDAHPRSIRGGHFWDDPYLVRSAARLKSDLAWNDRDPQIPRSKWWNADAPFVGFRIVRPLKQPSKQEIDQFFATYVDAFIGAR